MRHKVEIPNVRLAKALANDKRLLILERRRGSKSHFPPLRDGDLVQDGACTLLITEKLGVS
jgi:ArsR family transcriptional regulator